MPNRYFVPQTHIFKLYVSLAIKLMFSHAAMDIIRNFTKYRLLQGLKFPDTSFTGEEASVISKYNVMMQKKIAIDKSKLC